MARPRFRYLHRHGLGVRRLEIGESTTPVIAPLMLYPCEVPSGTQEEGAIWFDDDNHVLAFYNGSAIREVAGAPAGQATVPNYRPIFRGAAQVLTSEHNGALCIWSTAAGYLFTLPTPQLGLWFDFFVETTITSVGAKILTPASTFLVGTFIQSTDGTYTSAEWLANGTTIRSWNGNGTTTGGLTGDWLRVHAISPTVYEVYGMGRATGTEATPFATS